jgi:hypothetical protein
VQAGGYGGADCGVTAAALLGHSGQPARVAAREVLAGYCRRHGLLAVGGGGAGGGSGSSKAAQAAALQPRSRSGGGRTAAAATTEHHAYEKMATSTSKWGKMATKSARQPWVVTEKVHGANFCISTDGAAVWFAKRGAVLGGEEDFFGFRSAAAVPHRWSQPGVVEGGEAGGAGGAGGGGGAGGTGGASGLQAQWEQSALYAFQEAKRRVAAGGVRGAGAGFGFSDGCAATAVLERLDIF